MRAVEGKDRNKHLYPRNSCQFKGGKTSLINALLGADIISVAVVPLTSIVTAVKYGEVLADMVHFSDGKIAEIKPESLPEYVTERRNPTERPAEYNQLLKIEEEVGPGALLNG